MITVLGSRGFIGSEITSLLKAQNSNIFTPERNEDLRGKKLGKVIYCIGLTADAKRQPFDTIDAHINKLSDIIRYSEFDDITYASSTRVYVHGTGTASESGLIAVDVSDPFELFNLTKMTAEALLLNTVKDFKIVRYSNVYGTDISSENFLTAILNEAIVTGKVTLHTSADSAKDFISLKDAAKLTIDIVLQGKARIYNVASGINTTNQQITDKMVSSLQCEINYAPSAKRIVFPIIDTTAVKREFGFRPSTNLVDDIDILISEFKKKLTLP